MIDESGKYYLYRHIRHDTNEVFYIGIGYDPYRVKSKHARNIFWKYVVSKTTYDYDVLLRSNSKDFIEQKEVEFIRLYGRRDLGTGTLVNLTDGGEKGYNRSRSSVEKQIDTAKKNGTYGKMIERMRAAPKKTGKDHHAARCVYVYTDEGRCFKRFDTISDCCKFLNIVEGNVSRFMRLKKSLNGFLFLPQYVGDQIKDMSSYEVSRSVKTPIIFINKTGVVRLYESLTFAAKSLNTSKQYLSKKAASGGSYRGGQIITT